MEKEDRSFTIESCSTRKTGGRFIADSPYTAALHAAAEVCHNVKKCKNFKLSIRETTRGSKGKVYDYLVSRVKINRSIELDGKKVHFKNRYQVVSDK